MTDDTPKNFKESDFSKRKFNERDPFEGVDVIPDSDVNRENYPDYDSDEDTVRIAGKTIHPRLWWRAVLICVPILAIIAISGIWTYWVSQPEEMRPPKFIDQGHTIVDLNNKLVWLRCTGGMQYVAARKTCSGDPIPVNRTQAEDLVKVARDQLEDSRWRIPTRSELLTLVCKDCYGVKINRKFFPRTPRGSVWSDTVNEANKRYHWSVNFTTGHSFGKSAPGPKMYLRLVRDK